MSWGLSTTSFVSDVSTSQTYSATGIPSGCTFMLGFWRGGAIYLVSGSQLTVTLSSGFPSSTVMQTWPASEVGQDWEVRPLPVQAPCLSACGINPATIHFAITAGAPVSTTCATSLSIIAATVTCP